jgi:PAS domain S-box-containing protein
VFVALVVAAMLPVVGLVIASAITQRAQARRVLGAEAARVARLAALREADLIDGGRNMLASIAEHGPVRTPTSEVCSIHLGELLPLYPRFTNMGVVDHAGNLLCSAIRPREPLNFSDRPWFQRVMATHTFAVGDYQRGRITGKQSLVFGVPVVDGNGAVSNVAWAALDLTWLQQFAAQVKLPGKPALALLDRNGTILARDPDPERWVGSQVTDFPTVLRRLDAGPFESRGVDGIDRLYANVSLGDHADPHAIVAVGIPTSVAYDDANAALRRNLAVVVTIAALSIVVARLAANRLILDPSRSLVVVAERVAGGDLAARLGPPYPSGEIGAAARTFDAMAASLEARDQAVARLAHQLQAILDNAPALISMQDTEGRYILVNRQFETVRGVERERATGRTATELFGPEIGEELRLRDLEPVTTGTSVEGEEVIFVEDEPHWFLSLRFPLHDARGTLYAVCAILTDVTERIQAESQREALASQLQQSQRLESLGQLAGGIAHDFNNLLGVIINYADFIVDAAGEPGAEEAKPPLGGIRADAEAIFHAAETAATLTRQLLIFGRRDPVQSRVLDIADVVRGIEPLLRRTIGEDIELQLSLSSEPARVRADPGRLEQVVLNVAVNARDAMASGGRMTITTAVVDLDEGPALEARVPPGRWIRLDVSDTGIGMTQSVAARAFEPFFTTKPKGHGTGLGLATVFGVIRDAGGHVVIDSHLGEGTTIRVYLPAVEAAVTTDGGAPGVTSPEGGGRSVLVVEDDDVMREVARRILTGHGYAVRTAADATEALRICENDTVPIDLVLSDVVMPGLSGPDLIERLRSVRPGVRSIYMSGYPEDFVARRHPHGEDVVVIRKPFTPGGLLRQIQRALEGDP